MRTADARLGVFECRVPDEPIVVGMPCTVILKYIAGKYGIDDGGSICFVRHGVTDWQKMNFEEETALGYSSIRSNADVRLIVEERDGIRPYETEIAVKVRDGCLKEGDYIELVMGDTSKGALGILAQTVAETKHLLFVKADPVGSGRYEKVGDSLHMKIWGGGIADYDTIVPSTVRLNEPFSLKIRVVDDYGNRCENFTGSICFEEVEGLHLNKTVFLTKEDKGCKSIQISVEKPGTYILKSRLEGYGLEKKSNPFRVIGQMKKRLFWGDMHGQNALASGIGTMEDVFDFTKEVAAVDFTGWQGNDFEVSEEDWETVKGAIAKYNRPGEYVVFNGYEWSGITANGGDHNIYYKGDDCEIYRSSAWLWKDQRRMPVGREDALETECSDLEKLWEKFGDRQDVMAIPHVGGRHANFDYFHRDFTSVIEIYSHHGIFEWFMEEAIKRRMKVGFIAASDDHTSRVGLSYPMGTNGDIGATFDVKSGLTAVYADELSREGIWEAIKERRCYAATSSRMILDFSCNGRFMGSEFETEEFPEIHVGVVASNPINRIELYRDLEKIKTVRYIDQIREQEPLVKVKIVWSGVRTRFRRKSVPWKGQIFVKNGMLLHAENYSIDNAFEGIMGYNRHVLNFTSKTSGDEDGVILLLHAEDVNQCEIQFTSSQGNAAVKVAALNDGEKSFSFGEVNRKVVFSAENAGEGSTEMTLDFTDTEVKQGENFYYVKAFQEDGNRLWSSPIFVHYAKNTGGMK